jgi:SAM-dependent methyltransferase
MIDVSRRSNRFPFGRNWTSFLKVLNDERIAEAERSLSEKLGGRSIAGATFLDIGSGSGIFSLAAMRLGASKVHSFDFDPDSVRCTQELRRRYYPDAAQWTVEQASVLDDEYLQRLGQWDIVYSWGVLHHTGQMWRALELVTGVVREGGRLFIAIYNDQGRRSAWWAGVKRLYNRGAIGRAVVLSTYMPYYVTRGVLVDLARRRNPAARYREYQRIRGMSAFHDWKDWLGGYPFEVATPDAMFDFFRGRGFTLNRLSTCGGKQGCNEFVFIRTTAARD